MKDFVCKKCKNTAYIIQEKLNGTGKALRLYCAKCGTWHKWLNKQEKVVYATVDSNKDKEIARLTAELDEWKRRAEVAEQNAMAWKDCANKWQKYYKEEADRDIEEERKKE